MFSLRSFFIVFLLLFSSSALANPYPVKSITECFDQFEKPRSHIIGYADGHPNFVISDNVIYFSPLYKSSRNSNTWGFGSFSCALPQEYDCTLDLNSPYSSASSFSNKHCQKPKTCSDDAPKNLIFTPEKFERLIESKTATQVPHLPYEHYQLCYQNCSYYVIPAKPTVKGGVVHSGNYVALKRSETCTVETDNPDSSSTTTTSTTTVTDESNDEAISDSVSSYTVTDPDDSGDDDDDGNGNGGGSSGDDDESIIPKDDKDISDSLDLDDSGFLSNRSCIPDIETGLKGVVIPTEPLCKSIGIVSKLLVATGYLLGSMLFMQVARS